MNALNDELKTTPEKKVKPAGPRRKRASLDKMRLKLDAPVRKGFVRRWVNDDGNRVQDMHDRDYEYVEDPKIHTDGEGSRVARRVGVKKNGEPLFAYLMEIKEEYHAEDQREKMKPLDEFQQNLERAKAGTTFGDNMVVDKVDIHTTKG